MATVSTWMISLGINVTGMQAGLQRAKNQIGTFNKEAQKLGSAFAGAAAANALLIYGLYQLQSAIRTAFRGGLKAADDYRLTVLNVASTLTDMTEKGADRMQVFNDHLIYSQQMFKVLELVAARHFASGYELQLAWTLMAQKGIALRIEEAEHLGVIVDKIKLITQGQMSTVQISQEIRSLLNGQARTTDQLAVLLHNKYGKEWKNIVNQHREAGDLLSWLAQEFEGLAIASEHIYDTLEAQATTLWTMIRRVGREGLTGAYEFVVDVIKRINEYLFEHEATVAGAIHNAWVAILPIVQAILGAIAGVGAYLYQNGETIAASIRWFGEMLNWVIQIAQAVFQWASNHSTILLTLGMIWASYRLALTAAAWIGVLEAAVVALKAQMVLLGAATYLNPLIAAIGVVVAVLGAAALAAYNFGNYLDDVLEKQKKIQKIEAAPMPSEVFKVVRETRGTPVEEMIKEREPRIYEFVEKYGELIPYETQINKLKREEIALQKQLNGLTDSRTAGSAEEAAITTLSMEKSKERLGLEDQIKAKQEAQLEVQKKVLETGIASLEVKQGFFQIVPPVEKKELAYTAKENEELVKYYQDKNKLLKGGAKDEEDANKKTEGLYYKKRQLYKAMLDYMLAQYDVYLKNLESKIELEKELLEFGVESGYERGSELAKSELAAADATAQAKMMHINKQIEAEKKLYDLKIEAIQVDEKLTPAKAGIEMEIAKFEWLKKQLEMKQELNRVPIDREIKVLQLLKEQVQARRNLRDELLNFALGQARTPLGIEAAEIAKARMQVAELIRQIEQVKITTITIKADSQSLQELERSLTAIKEKAIPSADIKVDQESLDKLSKTIASLQASKIPGVDEFARVVQEWKTAGKLPGIDEFGRVITGLREASKQLGETKITLSASDLTRLDRIVANMKAEKLPWADQFAQTVEKFKAAGGQLQMESPMVAQLMNLAELFSRLDLPWAEKFYQAVMMLMSGDENAITLATEELRRLLSGPILKDMTLQIQIQEQVKGITKTLTSAFSELVTSMLEGGKDVRKVFQNFFKSLLNEALKPGLKWLETQLQKALESMFEAIGQYAASAILAVIAILGMMFMRESGGEFTPSGAETGVTTHEAVRGVVAGETTIPIGEISVSLSEAVAPHLDVLRQNLAVLRDIELNTRSTGGQVTATLIVEGLNDRLKDWLDEYFAQYAMTGGT